MTTALTRSYRDRIYGKYVSSFKGQLSADELLDTAKSQARFFDHLFRPLMDLSQPQSVLEAGCGPGHFLYWARERGIPSVQGFDLSSQQVEAARSLGLPAEVASFQRYLPKFVEVFDLIVGLDIIEHLTRDEAFEFLELCHRALKPGGYIFLTTPNGGALYPGPVVYGDLTHETIFTPQTIDLALRLSDYGSIHIREIIPPPTSFRSRTRRVLWRLIRLWPMIIDLIETGSKRSSGIYSRVMAVQAQRVR
jgi:2-polyprenyl-3-methyl-5-hydroxy-6-metoxy-1,4-benzoquinol methylase